MSAEKSGLAQNWAWALCAGVLLGAVLLQGVGRLRSVPPARAPHLAATLGTAPAGWKATEVPLGSNEFLSNEVEKVLKYDDVINREYRQGADYFGIYAAYWGPGKMPVQLVASHTPDRCWTENGWRCLEMRFKQPDVLAGAGLLPAEWRRFEPPQGSGQTYVLYWHLVDGEPYDYGERFNAVPSLTRWWQGAIQQALRGNREQYFVRLTSNRPFEELWADPGFREIVRHLSALGLARPPSPART